MPHCIIEYAKPLEKLLDMPDICKQVHAIVVNSNIFTPAAIKSRLLPYDYYYIGADVAESHFIHVTISILKGRALEQRQMISQAVFALLKEQAKNVSNLSVNIHEMDKEVYCK